MPVTNTQGNVEHVLIWGRTIESGGSKVLIDWNVNADDVDIITMYAGAQSIKNIVGIQASTINLLLTGMCFEILLRIVT